MEAKEYKNKCIELLNEFEESLSNCILQPKEEPNEDWEDPFDKPQSDNDYIFNPYPDMDRILRDFKHLVYAFDKNLPLNTELSEPNTLKLSSPYVLPDENKKDIERIKYFMRFFISYIEEYCE